MRSALSKTFLIAVALGICTLADAGTRIEEVWVCQLNEGKTLADVHEANGAWVKFMNATVEGGDIHSYVATAVVGETSPKFWYIDSFPSMKSWIAVKAANDSEKGQAIEAVLNEVAKCESNTLYSTTETEAK